LDDERLVPLFVLPAPSTHPDHEAALSLPQPTSTCVFRCQSMHHYNPTSPPIPPSPRWERPESMQLTANRSGGDGRGREGERERGRKVRSSMFCMPISPSLLPSSQQIDGIFDRLSAIINFATPSYVIGERFEQGFFWGLRKEYESWLEGYTSSGGCRPVRRRRKMLEHLFHSSTATTSSSMRRMSFDQVTSAVVGTCFVLPPSSLNPSHIHMYTLHPEPHNSTVHTRHTHHLQL